jgi:hypothetical protein
VKKVKIEFELAVDALPARVEDVKHLLDLFEKELARLPPDDQYKRDQIRNRLYPLVSVYAEALSSGKAEDLALVHLQSSEVQARADESRLALEKFKVRSFHWTIRFALAAMFGIAWAVFA